MAFGFFNEMLDSCWLSFRKLCTRLACGVNVYQPFTKQSLKTCNKPPGTRHTLPKLPRDDMSCKTVQVI